MNHVNASKMRLMARLPLAMGLPIKHKGAFPIINCQSCSVAHMQPSPHKSLTVRPPSGHIIAADISGLIPTTQDGHTYFINFTALNPRMQIFHLLKTRTEAENYTISPIAKVQRHFGKPVAKLRCDNADENLKKILIKAPGEIAITI